MVLLCLNNHSMYLHFISMNNYTHSHSLYFYIFNYNYYFKSFSLLVLTKNQRLQELWHVLSQYFFPAEKKKHIFALVFDVHVFPHMLYFPTVDVPLH